MRVSDKVVVVTGGASGIGAALARRFSREGAFGVVVADRDVEGARDTASEIARAGGRALAVGADVTVEADVQAVVATAVDTFGPVDLMCSNAGVLRAGGADAPDQDWADSWAVNVMAHVYAARAVLPSMLERGDGYLLHTCSAAGLLTSPGAAPYAVTKHAGVALAEWLALSHAGHGIKVSALCPQGVRTPMLVGGLEHDDVGALVVAASGNVLEPDDVADAVIAGLDAERFLILPHPEVAEFERRRAQDHDRWLAGMRRLVATTSERLR